MASKSTPTPKGASEQPLRQPSQDQRGDIIEMLVTCYDRKAKRYTGAETDKTVADTIGGGCMPGWVAEIRERDFGPSGGNEEIEALRTEIAALSARLDRVCAAVGPRAR
uniref:hypothetical protein n=1 Tax=Paenirhodobacter enshiensis TaxID=1105367 RepID=UPI0035B18533